MPTELAKPTLPPKIPIFFQGLKADQALKIPASIIKESDLKGVTEDDEFIYHIVKKGKRFQPSPDFIKFR